MCDCNYNFYNCIGHIFLFYFVRKLEKMYKLRSTIKTISFISRSTHIILFLCWDELKNWTVPVTSWVIAVELTGGAKRKVIRPQGHGRIKVAWMLLKVSEILLPSSDGWLLIMESGRQQPNSALIMGHERKVCFGISDSGGVNSLFTVREHLICYY